MGNKSIANKARNPRSQNDSTLRKCLKTMDKIKKIEGCQGQCSINQPQDLRRCVFLSIIGLHHSYRLCSFYTLWNAILILPIKTEWIYNARTRKEIPPNQDYLLDILEDIVFLELLRCKHEQKLLFCAMDYKSQSVSSFDLNTSPKQALFWSHLSRRLTELYDPSNPSNCYNALKLEKSYWKHESKSCSMHSSRDAADAVDRIGRIEYYEILNEIHFLTLQFRLMRQILTENNKTLNVIVFTYCNDDQHRTVSKSVPSHFLNGDQNWWISSDYEDDDCEMN